MRLSRPGEVLRRQPRDPARVSFHCCWTPLYSPLFCPGHKTVRWQPWVLAQVIGQTGFSVTQPVALQPGHPQTGRREWGWSEQGQAAWLLYLKTAGSALVFLVVPVAPATVIWKEHWFVKSDAIIYWPCYCKAILPP